MSSKFMNSAKIHHIKFSKSIVWNTFPIYVFSNSFQMQVPTSLLHVRNIDKGRSIGAEGFQVSKLNFFAYVYHTKTGSYPTQSFR